MSEYDETLKEDLASDDPLVRWDAMRRRSQPRPDPVKSTSVTAEWAAFQTVLVRRTGNGADVRVRTESLENQAHFAHRVAHANFQKRHLKQMSYSAALIRRYQVAATVVERRELRKLILAALELEKAAIKLDIRRREMIGTAREKIPFFASRQDYQTMSEYDETLKEDLASDDPLVRWDAMRRRSQPRPDPVKSTSVTAEWAAYIDVRINTALDNFTEDLSREVARSILLEVSSLLQQRQPLLDHEPLTPAIMEDVRANLVRAFAERIQKLAPQSDPKKVTFIDVAGALDNRLERAVDRCLVGMRGQIAVEVQKALRVKKG